YRLQGLQLDIEDFKQMDMERMRRENKLPALRLYKDDQTVGFATSSLTLFTVYTFTADGRYVAAAAGEVIHLFRVPDMQPVASFSGHEGSVFALAVSSDSRYLFSAGGDQTLRIWNLADLPPVDFNRVDEEAVEQMRKMIALDVKEATSQTALM